MLDVTYKLGNEVKRAIVNADTVSECFSKLKMFYCLKPNVHEISIVSADSIMIYTIPVIQPIGNILENS